MLGRLKDSFDSGFEKIKWVSAVLSERLKVELAVLKLLWQSNDLDKQRNTLKQSIGERVFEIRGRQDADLLKDTRIKRDIAELERLEVEIKDIKSKVSETGKAEE